MPSNYWQTERVRIRAFDNEDIERMVRERDRRDAKLDWLHDVLRFPETPEKIREDYAETLTLWSKDNDDRCLLAVENSEGEYAGELSVWFTKRPEMYLIYGICIIEKFRGKGLGKDALKLLLDYYFNEKGFRKAEAHVYSYNPASRAFHEKFGFTHEGTLRGRIFSRGKAHDVHVYGILADEFNAIHEHSTWMR
ncbi:MAG: GNAT family N-acetyltransferase [Defluviitaleaceae bacterium]|nr:GNAT family N-acetyltransferase [Defluviitaleaceae bacterium]